MNVGIGDRLPEAVPHPASFRDPDSRVHLAGARVLRAFSGPGAARYAAVEATGLLERLQALGLLVAAKDVEAVPAARVIEHERLPFVSYPYEWPFALLKAAALLHLEVQRQALEAGVVLADASAYNVQFRGTVPVFIDHGSFRPYVEGELWSAHGQFCEHFLNPLLLAAEVGVPFRPFLRGSLEGVPSSALAAMLPARRWASWRHVLHVLLPAKAERVAREREAGSMERIRGARLPREAYGSMLRQLHRWIAALEPRGSVPTTWEDYAVTRTYASEEVATKRRVVEQFAAAARPAMLWDLGCNDGEFTQAALEAGATRAVGFDADAGALERAVARARARELDLLPLYQDAADPSPARGWRGTERASLAQRGPADAVMALAFIHHLALGRNLPLGGVVDFIVAVAPRGLVEFVPKSDPTVRRMLALKGDIFPGYDKAAFERELAARARIVAVHPVSASGRELYVFER